MTATCKFILGAEGFCGKAAIYKIKAPNLHIDGVFCAEHGRRYEILSNIGIEVELL